MPAATSKQVRPRRAAAERAILETTLAVLAEDGYAGLTTDRIAREAGVSKATMYRRWPTKQDVVIAAAQSLAHEVPVPDTGSLRGDLTAIAEGLAAVFAAPRTAALVGALVGQLPHDPGLADALRTGLLAPRRDAARTALRSAAQRGELGRGIDIEIAVDLLAGPFYYRLLLTGDRIDRAFAHAVVDAVLAWVGSPSPRS